MLDDLKKTLSYIVEPVREKFPEIVESVSKLTEDKEIQGILGKAGTIGALFNIGFYLFNRINQDLTSPERRAFASLMKIVAESAKEALSSSSQQINMKEIKTEDVIKELFEIFNKTVNWKSYLPDHPVIADFRIHIVDILKREKLYREMSKFVVEFNFRIEEKASKDPDIKELRMNWKLKRSASGMTKYLEHVRSLIEQPNPFDDKALSEYHIKNRAIEVDKDTWDKDYRQIPYTTEQQWEIESFLNSDYGNRIIIGATFGIGKTALVKHIAARYASEYLNGSETYIPIFVSLKDKLYSDYFDGSLDNVLKNRMSISNGESQSKVLLICDGLDEYGEQNLIKLVDELRRYEDNPNIKIILATRLEAGFPDILHINKYIRLLPFDKEQVNEFFSASKYNIPDITYPTLEEHGLQEQEALTPLFCWMFAVTYPKSQLRIEETQKQHTRRALLYLNFIHSIVLGKYRGLSKGENQLSSTFDYEKWIIRKIAALKMIYEKGLTEDKVREWLKKFAEDEKIEGLKQFLEDKLNGNGELLKPILTSYFHLRKTGKTPFPVIDFIHESFKEYLLAEYYIESILKDKYYRLNVGIPSRETMEFLNGLLELLSKENDSYQIIDTFLESLIIDEDTSVSKAEDTLVRHAHNSFNNERIILQAVDEDKDKELWTTHQLISYIRYHDLWIHRWLSLYVLKTLDPDNYVDRSGLLHLIECTSDFVPYYLKKLVKVQLQDVILLKANLSFVDLSNAILSNADLTFANLTGADLSNADLLGANLSNANLLKANLLYTDLSGANLTFALLLKANLSNAILSNADLTFAKLNYTTFLKADLSGADLSGADLLNANLSGANLSNAKLNYTTFLKADLSNATLLGVDLFGANLSGANLSGANLSVADLSGANLSNANLSGVNLSNADLSGVNLSNANLLNADLSGVNLSNANLLNANLSGVNLSKANLSGANLSKANLSGANLSNANLSNTSLLNANLSKTTLSKADLLNANLINANLLYTDLSGANLSIANLSGVNLSNASLLNANLSSAILLNANLTFANLLGADLSAANLFNANLTDANLTDGILLAVNLTGANLSGANLLNANLTFANLLGANLSKAALLGANLSDADLSYSNVNTSVMLNCNHFRLVCHEADFDNAMFDSKEFVDYLRNNNGENIKDASNNKNELENRLKESGFDNEKVQELLKYSSLPDNVEI